MILARTPFRATLGGGGTDLPSYYEKHGGLLFAMGVDKYMYVAINQPVLDRKIRVHYTKIEAVDNPRQLQHDLARETLLHLGVEEKMEISSLADLKAGGGMGSPSCYTVALLHALRAHLRQPIGLPELAEESFAITHGTLGMSVGKQDPYLAAFGGMTVLEIDKDGAVAVRNAKTNAATLIDFIANTHLYYTGIQGGADQVLRFQDHAMRDAGQPSHETVRESLHGIKEIGYGVLEAIESENYDDFGRLMDKHWDYKKLMSAKINIPGIDDLYRLLKERFGVLGGKVSGAGGGGFFMVYAPSHHAELDEFMTRHGLSRMHYRLDTEGAKILTSSPH
jgi:D-glycero-alpha-D-manno-heptose-7-phosphate kinase